MQAGLDTIWDYVLAAVAAVGGIGVVILGISSWIGKIWTNKIMQGDLNRHSESIEALKTRLASETEKYKTQLRKSELLFGRQFEAANDLTKLIHSIEFSYYDPWMDDYDQFIEHVEGTKEGIAASIEGYLAKHAAILGDVVKDAIVAARYSCILARSPEVPGGADAETESRNCYEKLKFAEAEQLKVVREQSSIEAAEANS